MENCFSIMLIGGNFVHVLAERQAFSRGLLADHIHGLCIEADAAV
jgi:hypothetical protein